MKRLFSFLGGALALVGAAVIGGVIGGVVGGVVGGIILLLLVLTDSNPAIKDAERQYLTAVAGIMGAVVGLWIGSLVGAIIMGVYFFKAACRSPSHQPQRLREQYLSPPKPEKPLPVWPPEK